MRLWKTASLRLFALFKQILCRHRTPAFPAPADIILRSAPCARRSESVRVQSRRQEKRRVWAQGCIFPEADGAAPCFLQQRLTKLFCFKICKSQGCTYWNMTVSVLPVILYHAFFRFARGKWKKYVFSAPEKGKASMPESHLSPVPLFRCRRFYISMI